MVLGVLGFESCVGIVSRGDSYIVIRAAASPAIPSALASVTQSS